MSMSIPHYPNPYDTASPLANAFGWISTVALDAGTGSGRVALSIHPSAGAAMTNQPIAYESRDLGSVIIPGTPAAMDGSAAEVPPITFRTLDEFLQDPEFAQAFGVLVGKLEAEFLKVPALADATINH